MCDGLQRLKMVPGLPAFEWWATPPDEVLLRVWVFNVTNQHDFESGRSDKLRMQEVGPFVFRYESPADGRRAWFIEFN